MIDRDARFQQHVTEKLEGLFSADAFGRDGLADQLLQFLGLFGKSESSICLCDAADGEFDDVEGHLNDVDINVVHCVCHSLETSVVANDHGEDGQGAEDYLENSDLHCFHLTPICRKALNRPA